jgi:hypothetical protein
MVGQYLSQTNETCYSVLQCFFALLQCFSGELNTAMVAPPAWDGTASDKCTLSTTPLAVHGKWPARSACQWEHDKLLGGGHAVVCERQWRVGPEEWCSSAVAPSDGRRHHLGSGYGPARQGDVS